MRHSGRKIIHLDMDAFYASVEQRDFPELAGTPVIVGGSPTRGVVSAASYEARRYGVHSAMPMARALALCPGARVRRVRMSRYREVSAQVFEIFSAFTDRVEPLSIDEAFLDVTGCERLYGEAAVIAARIRAEVKDRTGLNVSAGVAANKFLAKLASDHCKPDGLLEVKPQGVDGFLLPLSVRCLWGVGRVTAQRLEGRGIRTIADLRQYDRRQLEAWFGSSGAQIHRLAHGLDDRPVVAGEGIKSIGHEDTYELDLHGVEEVRKALLDLAERVARRLRRKGLQGRVVSIKVRYADFQTVTRSLTLDEGVDHSLEIYRQAASLVMRTEAGWRPVRLLGISLSRLEERDAGQQGLFARPEKERSRALDEAMDRVRDRYGELGIRRATLVDPDPSGSKTGR